MGKSKTQSTRKKDMGNPEKEIEKETKKDIVSIESGEVVTYEQGNILDVFGREDVETFGKKLELASQKAKKIRLYAISMTNERDWVDQGGLAYLTSSGGEVIRRTFGIDIIVDRIEREDFEEEKYYVYTVYGRACKNGVCQSDIGTRSSKDKFFAAYTSWENGKKETKFKEMTEVDITDIKKAAVTNFEIRAISKFAGLRNVSFKELEMAGLKIESIAKVPYEKKKGTEKSKKPEKTKSEDDLIKDRLEKLSIPTKDKKELKASLSALTTEAKNAIRWQLSLLEKMDKSVVGALYTIPKSARGELLRDKNFQQLKTEEQLQIIKEATESNIEDEDVPFNEDGTPKEEG